MVMQKSLYDNKTSARDQMLERLRIKFLTSIYNELLDLHQQLPVLATQKAAAR